MSPTSNEPDELLEQVLEDDRAAALQAFLERGESTREPAEPLEQ